MRHGVRRRAKYGALLFSWPPPNVLTRHAKSKIQPTAASLLACRAIRRLVGAYRRPLAILSVSQLINDSIEKSSAAVEAAARKP